MKFGKEKKCIKGVRMIRETNIFRSVVVLF